MADIYDNNGRKIGSVHVDPPMPPVLIGILFILIVALAVYIFTTCSEINTEKEIKTNDTVLAIDLLDRDPGSWYCEEEIAWMNENYPDVIWTGNGGANRYTGVGYSERPCSYDDSFRYFSGSFCVVTCEPNDYHQNCAIFACFPIDDFYKVEFQTLKGVVYLEKEGVEDWIKSPDYNMNGFIVIFGDNKMLYQSAKLTPNGMLSVEFEVDVTGIKNIVVCIVGSAYLGEPYFIK